MQRAGPGRAEPLQRGRTSAHVTPALPTEPMGAQYTCDSLQTVFYILKNE